MTSDYQHETPVIFKDMTEEKPLISVLILTYNQEKFISHTINGVLLQEGNFEVEIIIADDCSTDNTSKICTEFQNRYPKKIVHIINDKNEGVIKNYFRSIKLCKGEFIAVCAGDDYWIDPFKLQKQIKILKNNKEIVLVYTNWIRIQYKDTKAKIAYTKLPKNRICYYGSKTNIENVLLGYFGYYPKPSTICFRKAPLLTELNSNYDVFTNPENPGESHLAYSFLAKHGNFEYLEDPTTVYRHLESSVSHFEESMRKNDFIIAYLKMRLTLVQVHGLSKLFSFLYSNLNFYNLLKSCFLSNNKELALRVSETYNTNYKLIFPGRKIISFFYNKLTRNIGFIISKVTCSAITFILIIRSVKKQ